MLCAFATAEYMMSCRVTSYSTNERASKQSWTSVLCTCQWTSHAGMWSAVASAAKARIRTCTISLSTSASSKCR